MRSQSAILLAILSILLLPYLFSQEEAPTVSEKSIIDYKIGPKDLLEISVFGHKDLDTRVRVSEEGKITFPLIGDFAVEGLTKTEVESKLSLLLKEKYLQDPQVTIFILEYQSKRVSVLGAVGKPGSYEIIGRRTLLDIIAQAGGFTGNAGDEIIIMRELGNGTKNSLKISIEDLTVEGKAELNIPLQPNDVVNIPIDETVYVYVFGQVRSPGALEVKKSQIPTLLRAIAMAGGFSERASKGGVILKRKDESGKETQQKVNVKDIIKGKKKDIQLKDGDIVYVPETLF